jgi:hypothetical protein
MFIRSAQKQKVKRGKGKSIKKSIGQHGIDLNPYDLFSSSRWRELKKRTQTSTVRSFHFDVLGLMAGMHLALIRLEISSRPQYASRGLDLCGCRIVFAHEISGSI